MKTVKIVPIIEWSLGRVLEGNESNVTRTGIEISLELLQGQDYSKNVS